MDTEQQAIGLKVQPAGVLRIMAGLEECLEREAASLTRPDMPDLAAIAAEKSRHLDALLPLDQALRAVALPLQAEEPGALLQRWFAMHGSTREEVMHLQACLVSCQRLNQRNGALLRARQYQVALRLQVLGVLPEPAVYTAQGVMSGGRRGMTSLHL
jgi:flagellar biosynthesis/type III secretory pathway chaperone